MWDNHLEISFTNVASDCYWITIRRFNNKSFPLINNKWEQIIRNPECILPWSASKSNKFNFNCFNILSSDILPRFPRWSKSEKCKSCRPKSKLSHQAFLHIQHSHNSPNSSGLKLLLFLPNALQKLFGQFPYKTIGHLVGLWVRRRPL